MQATYISCNNNKKNPRGLNKDLETIEKCQFYHKYTIKFGWKVIVQNNNKGQFLFRCVRWKNNVYFCFQSVHIISLGKLCFPLSEACRLIWCSFFLHGSVSFSFSLFLSREKSLSLSLLFVRIWILFLFARSSYFIGTEKISHFSFPLPPSRFRWNRNLCVRQCKQNGKYE